MTEINNNKELTFESLGINNEIIKSVNEYGILKPTNIQCEIINSIINSNGNDVVIKSVAGTGKSVAVIISLLQLQNYNNKKNENDENDSIILFLTPTRELSMALRVMVQALSNRINGGNYKVRPCIGGVNIKEDIEKFKNESIQFIIGTPGRILDLISRNAIISINKIKLLVLDEADEIFSRGFIDQINDINQLLSLNSKTQDKELQTIISTSTINNDCDLSKFIENKLNKSYKLVSYKSNEITLDRIHQFYIQDLENDNYKFETLIDLLNEIKSNLNFKSILKLLIYSNNVEKLSNNLNDLKIKNYSISSKIHSDKEEDDIINSFKNDIGNDNGDIIILILNDNFLKKFKLFNNYENENEISLIINYDLPIIKEKYIYRCAIKNDQDSNKLIVISFISNNEKDQLKEFENYYSCSINELPENFVSLLKLN